MPIVHRSGTDDPRVRWPRLVDALASGLGRLHTGAQVFISQRGVPLADFGLGEARPGVPMTPDTVVPWLSAGKPLTAAALLVLCERGLLSLDAPVRDVIPEFGAAGKELITWRHLLTHTSGLPLVETGWPDATWNESVRRVCEAALPDGVVSGERAAYQPAATWFVLGEAASRLTGLPFPLAIRQLVLDPLGMTNTLCGTTTRDELPPADRTGGLLNRERTGLALSDWHRERWVAAPSPGSNVRGPARKLGAFYESLLGLRPPAILPADAINAMTARQRAGRYDSTFQHVVDFGLGVIVQSNRYGVDTVPYGFGRFSAESAFGHGGSQCSLGFADPTHGLVVVCAANGRPGEPQHQRRNRAVCEAVYEALGVG